MSRLARVLAGLVGAFLVAIAAAQIAYRVSTDPGDAPAQEAWAQNRMQFVAWNDARWTAWVRGDPDAGDLFEKVPQDTARWSRHANASIAYRDWDGEAWQAKIDGDEFLLARQGNWDERVIRSDAIRYRDWAGNEQIRTVSELRR